MLRFSSCPVPWLHPLYLKLHGVCSWFFSLTPTVPVTSWKEQEVGVEVGKNLSPRVMVNICTALFSAQNKLIMLKNDLGDLAERLNGGRSPWIGKKISPTITNTINNDHSDACWHLSIRFPFPKPNHTLCCFRSRLCSVEGLQQHSQTQLFPILLVVATSLHHLYCNLCNVFYI